MTLAFAETAPATTATTAMPMGGAAPASTGDLLMSMFPPVLVVLVFWLLVLRPQQKRAKEHQKMLSQLKRGDQVITNGGLIGTISRVVEDKNEFHIELAENVRVRVLKDAIAQVLSKSSSIEKSDNVTTMPDKKAN